MSAHRNLPSRACHTIACAYLVVIAGFSFNNSHAAEAHPHAAPPSIKMAAQNLAPMPAPQPIPVVAKTETNSRKVSPHQSVSLNLNHPGSSHSDTRASINPKELKKFILLSYYHIASEALHGKGQYLSALYELASVNQERREKTLANIRTSLLSQKSIYSFAETVSKQLAKN